MAITAAMRQDLMELVVLTNNAAPGTKLLGELVIMANSGKTLTEIAESLVARPEFISKYPIHQTATDFGQEWISNILPEADAALQAECVTIVEAHINGGGSVADLIVSVQAFMSDPANASGALKTHIDNFDNKVAVATYHTITKETAGEWDIPATVTSDATSVAAGNATVDVAIAPPAAQPLTLDLTTAANNLVGADTNDYVDGSLDSTNQTLTTSDSVNGGAGTDTLYAEISGTGTYTPTINNVETIQGNFSGAGTISLLRSGGYSTLENLDSTAAVTYSNVSSVDGLTVKSSNSGQAVTVTGTTAAVAGTSDAINLTVSNVSAGLHTVNGVETFNITSMDVANTLTLAGSKLATVNVSGDQNLTLGTLPATVGTLNASSLTSGRISATAQKTTGYTATGSAGADVLSGAGGNDTIDGGAGKDTITSAAGVDSLTGGDGDDVFVLAGNLTAADVVSGGEGTDTLSISAAVTTAQANVTGIEVLATSFTGADQSLAVFTGTTIATAAASGTGGNVGFTAAPAGTNFALTGAAPGNATWDLATDTIADSLTVTVGRTAGATTVTDLIVDDIETLTISSTGSALGVDFTDLSSSDLTSVTFTGSKAIDVKTSDATGVTSVDGAAMTARLDWGSTASAVNVASTVTGGSAGDSLRGGSGIDTLTGNGGADTLIGAAGNDIIDGGAGNDNLQGGNNNDNITGGDGNDTIDSGTGRDTVIGGAGNDTFVFDTAGDLTGGATTARDSVDGGDGTDIVQITETAALTPHLLNVEHVDSTQGAATALNLTNATSLTSVDIENNSHANSSITGLASGVQVNIKDADAGTIDYVAGASAVINIMLTGDGISVADAADVTLKAVGSTTEDFAGVALDNTDTTALTVIGGASAAIDIDTGAITQSDKLATLNLSTSVDGATLEVGTIADADSLTSITANGVRANIDTGAIGGTGTAENLSTITATADYGSVVTLGAITADTTNSLVENDLTITATTDSVSGSRIVFGNVDNTQGNITGTFSGGGDVDTGNLTGVDVTLDISSGDTSTIADVTASDDIVITTSGSGKVTFTALSGSDDVTFTSTSTDTVTITTIEDGHDDITINASGATGALVIGTNSDTGATSVMDATGGSGNDSLVGAAGNDILTGGAGNDELEGAAGNDTLTGGDGNDTITTGAGVDSVVAGAGNDTIVLAANLASTDKIDGGDGTDTATFTVNATTGTLSGSGLTNVEKATISFGSATGGAYSGGGSVSDVTIAAGQDNTAVTLTNIPAGGTVNLVGTNANDVTTAFIDSAGGALTLNLGNSQAGATADGDITLQDVTSLTIAPKTAAANFDDVALDNTDTTSVTFTNATALNLVVDDFSNSDKVASFTATTSSTGTIDLGTMPDADSLTSLTLNAGAADITVGVIGADAANNDAAGLANIDLTTGTATLTVGNVFMDTTDTAAGDLAAAINITVGAGGTGTFGTFDNEEGTTTVTIANDGTINQGTFLSDLNNGGITMNISGAGSTTITHANGGTGDVTVTGTGSGAKVYTLLTSADDATITHSGAGALTITAVAVTDDLTLDVSGAVGTLNASSIAAVGGVATVTGSADSAFAGLTLANTSASSANVTLGVNGVTDQLKTGTTSLGKVTVTNFVTGALASGGDAIDLDLSGIEGGNGQAVDLLKFKDAGTNVAANDSVSIYQLNANTALDLADVTNAGDNVLMLKATFATSDMVETALETGGANNLKANGAVVQHDAILVAWSDATNSYLGMAHFSAAVANDAKAAAGTINVHQLVEFVGVSDVTKLTAANLGGAILA